MKLSVRRTRTVIGTRAFAVSAAVIWNSLPAELSDVVHPDILAEAESFLHQLENLTAVHLRTV